MHLPDGYCDLPAGKIASVVTSLQTFERPALRPAPFDRSWLLRPVRPPTIDWYRDLFHRIGDDWLWFSRLQHSDDALQSIIQDPLVDIHAFRVGARDEGLLELDFRVESDCELAFLGLTAPLLGQGAGRWLMNKALEFAWSRPIKRFWLHTCTLDHPGALPFYIRSGLVPFRRQVEIADDPRLAGYVPRTAAPQVPFLR
jgi:GNAT superfamily N-acetyltransferase